ncbi:helix-turn-helix domain-containing protein [Chengkuizengella sp. SCS-71B]|uniref:helix-turn-helix domain-containing protein n=1 Tax=Chengkuizengella sp. SCS-71B TaxID=3115290 RepID=UPI0032C23B20
MKEIIIKVQFSEEMIQSINELVTNVLENVEKNGVNKSEKLLPSKQKEEQHLKEYENKEDNHIDELPEILTAQDIANYLKISRRRVYGLYQLNPEQGGIPNFSIGNSHRVVKEDFLDWIKEKKQENFKKYTE